MSVEPMNGIAQNAPAATPADRPALTLAQLILFVAGFVPLLGAFFVNLWERPHYQFFPLALAAAAFLAWSRFKETPRPLEPGSPSAGKLLWAFSFLLLLIATVLWSPWPGS